MAIAVIELAKQPPTADLATYQVDIDDTAAHRSYRRIHRYVRGHTERGPRST